MYFSYSVLCKNIYLCVTLLSQTTFFFFCGMCEEDQATKQPKRLFVCLFLSWAEGRVRCLPKYPSFLILKNISTCISKFLPFPPWFSLYGNDFLLWCWIICDSQQQQVVLCPFPTQLSLMPWISKEKHSVSSCLWWTSKTFYIFIPSESNIFVRRIYRQGKKKWSCPSGRHYTNTGLRAGKEVST